MILISPEPLSIDEAWKQVVRPECGAVCLFAGTVRNHHEGKKVVQLKYTAFDEMARKEIKIILDEAAEKWQIGRGYVAHRVGTLQLTETSVIVAISAPHRKEAFSAARYTIDELKKRVPVWKEEFYETGKAWVSCSDPKNERADSPE